MRVTNFMVHNQSLNNINRNMRHLSRIYEQTTSTKQISRPSQDPLIASRSLRFRTRLENNAQHQNNVENGHAWMNTTEAAFFNLLRGDATGSIFGAIIDELNAASSDPSGTLDDKLVRMRAIENYMEQIGNEMNQTYAGRFVFSGWRTEQPPILREPQHGISYVINQTFNIRDIEQTYALQRFPPGADHPTGDLSGTPIMTRVNILKLPFREANGTTLTFGTTPDPANPTFAPEVEPQIGDQPGQPLGIFRPEPGLPFDVVRRSVNDVNAFTPPNDGNTIHYIVETGELVFGDQVRDEFQNGTTVRYEVRDVQKGDLNPLIYFDTTTQLRHFHELNRFPNGGDFGPILPIVFPILMSEVFGEPFTIRQSTAFDTVSGQMQLAYNNLVAFGGNDLRFFEPDPANPGDYIEMAPQPAFTIDLATGMLTLTNPAEAAALNEAGIFVQFYRDEFGPNDIIPSSHPRIDVTGYPILTGHFPAEDQPIYYEFSHGSPIRVNTMARNVFTDKMFADLQTLIDFVRNIEPPDRRELEHIWSSPHPTGYGKSEPELTERVDAQIAHENSIILNVVNDRIENMMRQMEQIHTVGATREHTDLGSRMRRVEMFEVRLEQDEGNITLLKSENEDVDMTKALLAQAAAEAAFQGALRVIANNVQLSLINFV